MQANVIVTRAQDILQDTTSVRWTTAEILRWISDGQREVVLYRPEACVKSEAIRILAATGTKQTVTGTSGTALRLMDIVRNMGLNGATPGRAIRLVAREVMDAQNPNWHSDAASSEVKHYIYDVRNPLVYYVWPKPTADAYVEAVYSAAPSDVANVTDALSVTDIFANVLLDYTLYRAYLKDSEYAGNGQRALGHYQAFANALGIKGNVDIQAGPTANSPLNPNFPVTPKNPPAN